MASLLEIPMLHQLILHSHYKFHSSGEARSFVPQILDGKLTLVETKDDGVPTGLLIDQLTPQEWDTIDFVGPPPLLEGRQYLVLIDGSWVLSTWCVSRTRVDIPHQYYFHSSSVPFGAVVEKSVLVPIPNEGDAWHQVSIPDCLPSLGEEVLHVDKGENFARKSVYEHHNSRRYQGLNGLCFGPDNPAQAVRFWMPVKALIAA